MYRIIPTIWGLILLLNSSFCFGYDLADPQVWWKLRESERYERLKGEFAAYANYYVLTRGYRFGSGAQNRFESEFAKKAADEIMRQTPTDFESARNQVHKNIRKLIDRMIVEARKDSDYSRRNPGVIGEGTLVQALRFLCPLWPICQ